MTDMQKKMEQFFSPELVLYWRGKFGKLTAHFYADKLNDENLLKQFMNEAGIHTGRKVSIQDYEKVLAVAGEHGYSLCTIGGPEQE